MAISFTELTTKDCPIIPGTELATANKSGSTTVFAINGKVGAEAGSKSFTSPVESTIPLSIPKEVLIALKNPI